MNMWVTFEVTVPVTDLEVWGTDGPPDEWTAADAAAALRESQHGTGLGDFGGDQRSRLVSLSRRYPNPAYSGPDALFPDMTPPETITETVTL